jgi:hypothetical protein
MKEYPLTKRDLWSLGGLQLGTAVFFSLAGTCLGFWINVRETVAFADKVDPRVLGQWEGYGSAALVGAITTFLIGVTLLILSGIEVTTIIKETEHE